MGWEAFAQHSLNRISISYAPFGIFVMISLLAAFGVSLLRIRDLHGQPLLIAFVAVCAVLFSCLIYSVWQATHMFDVSYAEARSKHPSAAPAIKTM